MSGDASIAAWASTLDLDDDLRDEPEGELVAFANWVSKQGGLPEMIKSISKHLRRKGMSESHSIAVAVNAVRRMCATADTNFPGVQRVNAASRARACRSAARWEAMKKAARAS